MGGPERVADAQERNQLGAKLKDRGNSYYQAKQFQKAVEW
jgi:hypothetical protein